MNEPNKNKLNKCKIFIFILLIASKYWICYININIKKLFSFKRKNEDIKKTFLYIEDKDISNLNKKKPINISLSIDNSHVFPSLIVMTSALDNNDKKNHILIFYLLLSEDFTQDNIDIFESLKEKYDVRINYYYMINYFKKLKKWGGKTYAIYYKLFISILFPFLERMIHLDGDTVVFKDLWEMFNLPFNDNYFLAQPTRKDVFKDKVLKQNVINVGVMLINIKKLREDNKDFELIDYLFKKKFTEQILIGYVCIPKIGYLPFKYGIFFIGDIKTYKSHVEDNMIQRVNLTEVSEAMKDPTIVHEVFCSPKHWYKNTKTYFEKSNWCKRYQEYFYYYAKKTKYYKKIYHKYIKL